MRYYQRCRLRQINKVQSQQPFAKVCTSNGRHKQSTVPISCKFDPKAQAMYCQDSTLLHTTHESRQRSQCGGCRAPPNWHAHIISPSWCQVGQDSLTNSRLVAACPRAILYVSGSRFCCAGDVELAAVRAGVPDALMLFTYVLHEKGAVCRHRLQLLPHSRSLGSLSLDP